MLTAQDAVRSYWFQIVPGSGQIWMLRLPSQAQSRWAGDPNVACRHLIADGGGHYPLPQGAKRPRAQCSGSGTTKGSGKRQPHAPQTVPISGRRTVGEERSDVCRRAALQPADSGMWRPTQRDAGLRIGGQLIRNPLATLGRTTARPPIPRRTDAPVRRPGHPIRSTQQCPGDRSGHIAHQTHDNSDLPRGTWFAEGSS